MKLKLFVAAIGVLAGTSVVHADSVVFDGSSWTATTSGPVSSSTVNGTTTLANTTSGLDSGMDYVNLATPITSNSGIWTLSLTVTPNVPVAAGQAATYDFGFGNFSNAQLPTSSSIPFFSNSPNSFTGPWIGDQREPAANTTFAAGYHGGGNTFLGGPFYNVADAHLRPGPLPSRLFSTPLGPTGRSSSSRMGCSSPSRRRPAETVPLISSSMLPILER
jgi:hypothetical protein